MQYTKNSAYEPVVMVKVKQLWGFSIIDAPYSTGGRKFVPHE